MDTAVVALTDSEIRACFPVIQQLRPHLTQETFVEQVTRQRQSGYQHLYLMADQHVTCVAGIRISENLAWGRFLYVDDLVTDDAYRHQGHATTMMAQLVQLARESGCGQLHLDSGVQRRVAHRFYFRHNLAITSFHFSVPVAQITS